MINTMVLDEKLYGLNESFYGVNEKLHDETWLKLKSPWFK